MYHLILQTHHENHSLQLLEILDQKYKLATEQSYGFFYDVTDEHWQKYRDVYNTHVNHYNMSAPLTFHPIYSQRKAKYFNSAEAWYQTVSYMYMVLETMNGQELQYSSYSLFSIELRTKF